MLSHIQEDMLVNELETKMKIQDNLYIQARKETFKRYYKLLFKRLWDDDNILVFMDAISTGSDEDMERYLDALYDNGFLEKLYENDKSITQSLRCQAGQALEKTIAQILDQEQISYAKQVYVKDGIVCKRTKQYKGGHTLDFVVPKPNHGDNIQDYIHISAKTTLRERVHQDQHVLCRLNVVVTYDSKTQQAMSNGFTCITLIRNEENKQLNQLVCLLRKQLDSM